MFGAQRAITNVSTAYGIWSGVQALLLCSILGLVVIFLMKLVLIGVGIIAFGVMFFTVSIASRKKAMKMMDASAEHAANPVQTNNAIPADEVMVDYVVGVLAVGMRAASFGTFGGVTASHPENAIILTNKNVRFVYVPIAGGEVLSAPASDVLNVVTGVGSLFVQGDIEEKLKSILSTGGLPALANTDAKNFAIPLENLSEVKFNILGNAVFVDTAGKEYSYGLSKAENKEKIQRFFANYIKQA
jgi:hypothetical protein